MSGLDRRLSGLAPGLTARERAVLILRAIAEGQRDDSAWRRMPDSQVPAFDRYVGMARGINRVLVPYAAMLLGEVQTLEWRFQTLAVFVGWATERAMLGNALSAGARIPIPQSEYIRLVAEQRAGVPDAQ